MPSVQTPTEFVEVKDTIYFFINNGSGLVDTMIAVKRTNSRTIRLSEAIADTVTIEQQRLEIIGKNVDWNRTDVSLRIYDQHKIYYSNQFFVPHPQLTAGFGEEYQTGVNFIRYKDRTLIEMVSSVAPSLPGDESYTYYVFIKNDTLTLLNDSLNIFINKIQSHKGLYFSEFTDGCVTVTIPVEIDFFRGMIYTPFKDSAMFPVTWYTLSIGSQDDFDAAEPQLNIHLFTEPRTTSKYSTEPVHSVKEIELIKQFYPEYGKGDYKNVWTYIRIGKKYGWIFGEDRLMLGVDNCG